MLWAWLPKPQRLNPFEVREVLQARRFWAVLSLYGLNPFEVREVLQGVQSVHSHLL